MEDIHEQLVVHSTDFQPFLRRILLFFGCAASCRMDAVITGGGEEMRACALDGITPRRSGKKSEELVGESF